MPQQPVIAARITPMPWWEQCLMYLGVVIGVIASAFLRGTITLQNLGQRWLIMIVLSLFIALISMPFIYEQIKANNAPGLMRFGLFVQNGFFWETLGHGFSKINLH
jgi:hypothetical protein